MHECDVTLLSTHNALQLFAYCITLDTSRFSMLSDCVLNHKLKKLNMFELIVRRRTTNIGMEKYYGFITPALLEMITYCYECTSHFCDIKTTGYDCITPNYELLRHLLMNALHILWIVLSQIQNAQHYESNEGEAGCRAQWTRGVPLFLNYRDTLNIRFPKTCKFRSVMCMCVCVFKRNA